MLIASFGEVTGEELVGKVFIISWGKGKDPFTKIERKSSDFLEKNAIIQFIYGLN